MKYTFALLSVLGTAAAQGVTQSIAPDGSYPSGCSKDLSGSMAVSVVAAKGSKRGLIEKRACADTSLSVKLAGGVLTDSKGRTGYIAANYQWQFDAPAQTGAIYTAGFSVCNGLLALGPSTTFYSCQSGDFSNLYDRSWAAQCTPVSLALTPCDGSSTGGSSSGTGQAPDGQVQQIPDGQVQQIPDGQVQGPTGKPVSQIGDGQPQAPTKVSQIGDGQPQAPTGKPVSQIPDGQPQAPTKVSQIPDGQPQAPTGKPVTQISDGQPQAPTGKPVSQISDGQPQAPTGKPVSQISDGQPQAPTGKPVTQISDGQPQAPTGKPVSQISDGQPQAPTGKATSSSSPAPTTVSTNNGGRLEFASVAALAVGLVGAVVFL